MIAEDLFKPLLKALLSIMVGSASKEIANTIWFPTKLAYVLSCTFREWGWTYISLQRVLRMWNDLNNDWSTYYRYNSFFPLQNSAIIIVSRKTFFCTSSVEHSWMTVILNIIHYCWYCWWAPSTRLWNAVGYWWKMLCIKRLF